ncbi:MAG: GAF domain-containing protein [Blastochloris sp.]|nr:GAF domain-containing protein [Blastochloris sp.]
MLRSPGTEAWGDLGSSEKLLKALGQLRSWDAPAQSFWPALLELMLHLTDSEGVWIYFPPMLEPRHVLPVGAEGPVNPAELWEPCLSKGWAVRQSGDGMVELAIRLEQKEPNEPAVLVLRRSEAEEDWAEDHATLLRLLSDTPALYQKFKTERERGVVSTGALGNVEALGQVLEILAVLNLHAKYLPVTFALVNEVCSCFEASRVSLGWRRRAEEKIRLVAMSHTDRFEVNVEESRALEAVMEECLDQDGEILWSASGAEEAGVGLVSRQHGALGQRKGLSSMVSLPLRVEDQVQGVLTLERVEGKSFNGADILRLQLLLSQCGRRLYELERRDRWVGGVAQDGGGGGFEKIVRAGVYADQDGGVGRVAFVVVSFSLSMAVPGSGNLYLKNFGYGFCAGTF